VIRLRRWKLGRCHVHPSGPTCPSADTVTNIAEGPCLRTASRGVPGQRHPFLLPPEGSVWSSPLEQLVPVTRLRVVGFLTPRGPALIAGVVVVF
jgi:hypothetical protein